MRATEYAKETLCVWEFVWLYVAMCDVSLAIMSQAELLILQSSGETIALGQTDIDVTGQ